MENKSKIMTIVAIVIFAVVAGGSFWYWQKKSSVLPSPKPVIQKPIDQKTADISLGNQILEKTQNIIKNKFPETNPLKKIIKNPF